MRGLAWALALGLSLGAVGSAPDEAPGAFDGVSNCVGRRGCSSAGGASNPLTLAG